MLPDLNPLVELLLIVNGRQRHLLEPLSLNRWSLLFWWSLLLEKKATKRGPCFTTETSFSALNYHFGLFVVEINRLLERVTTSRYNCRTITDLQVFSSPDR